MKPTFFYHRETGESLFIHLVKQTKVHFRVVWLTWHTSPQVFIFGAHLTRREPSATEKLFIYLTFRHAAKNNVLLVFVGVGLPRISLRAQLQWETGDGSPF